MQLDKSVPPNDNPVTDPAETYKRLVPKAGSPTLLFYIAASSF